MTTQLLRYSRGTLSQAGLLALATLWRVPKTPAQNQLLQKSKGIFVHQRYLEILILPD
jgi:hypothetical protein